MSDLKSMSFVTGEQYAGVLGTNAEKPKDQSSLALSAIVSNASTSTTTQTTNTLTFTVTEGTSTVFGGIGNYEGSGSIINGTIWVQQPDGTKIDTATPPDASGSVVILPYFPSSTEGAVQFFIVNDPQPGEWTVGIVNDINDSNPFQVSVTTIPKEGIEGMIQGLQSLLPEGAPNQGSGEGSDSFAASATESLSFGCVACRVATLGLALVITSVGAAALTTLTATSAIVVALTNLAAWITAPIAIAFITGLATAVILTVDFVLNELCGWLGAC